MKKNRKYKKVKAPKKIKLDSIPKIHRRLFKMWSIIVRKIGKCEYCGTVKGEPDKSGKPLKKIDAHHLVTRYIKDNPLKWDILNSVAVCSSCHKFNSDSFHKSPVTTMDWLIKNHPERFNHVLKHIKDCVDLDNRKVLEEIEARLMAGQGLDIEKLQQIETQFPREVKKPVEEVGNLFDEPPQTSS